MKKIYIKKNLNKKVILAAHNSLSYAEPTKWWMKLINFTSKCQDLNIKEQFEYGVRLFDIRVDLLGLRDPMNWDYARSAHGVVTYSVFVNDALIYLNEMAEKHNEKIYVFLSVENLKYENEEYIDNFVEFFEFMKSRYQHLIFCGGYRKHPWVKMIDCEDPDIRMLFWEFLGFQYQPTLKEKIKALIKNIVHFSPKYWAKKNNWEYKSIENEGDSDLYLMLDYVQYV